MNDYNFNQLKNIKTPEEWMKKALDIPRKKKTPLIFSYKAYAFAAAIFVCVCAVTVAATINFNSDTVVKVSPTFNNSITQPQDLPNNTVPTLATEIYSTEQTDTTVYSVEEEEAYISETIGILPQTTYNTTITGNGTSSATSASIPSQLISSTIASTQDISSASTQQTMSAFVPNTTAVVATVPPTYSPPTQVVTEPSEEKTEATIIPLPSAPCVEPTEATVKPTSPTVEKTEPTEETLVVTSPQYTSVYNIYFQIEKESTFDMNNTMYCHIIDKNGNSLFEKFSEKEKCMVLSESSRRFVYCINTSENPLPNGTYTFIFYDEYSNSSKHNVVISYEKIINLYE